MALIAVMSYYNLTPKAAAKMLESLSEEKLQAIIQEYWQAAGRKFNGR